CSYGRLGADFRGQATCRSIATVCQGCSHTSKSPLKSLYLNEGSLSHNLTGCLANGYDCPLQQAPASWHKTNHGQDLQGRQQKAPLWTFRRQDVATAYGNPDVRCPHYITGCNR